MESVEPITAILATIGTAVSTAATAAAPYAAVAGAAGALATGVAALTQGGAKAPAVAPAAPSLGFKPEDLLAAQQQARDVTQRRGRAATILTGGGAFGSPVAGGTSPLKTVLGA